MLSILKNRDSFQEFTSYIKGLKENYQLTIFDTHVHPLDVIGVMEISDYNFFPENSAQINYSARALERLGYGKIAILLLRTFCKFLPGIVSKNIKKIYKNTSIDRLVSEMTDSLIDKCVLLPVEPLADTESVYKNFNHRDFYVLGSIDVQSISIEHIPERVERLVTEFGISGIKLHPNLQNFYPQPSDNPPVIADKLRLIYKLAEDNNLYLLFHGGRTFCIKKKQKILGPIVCAKDKALLANFYNIDEKYSEIFDNYNVPIVIAHMGHYGILTFNIDFLVEITRKYKNIFFDTAGVSRRCISLALKEIGSERILFGSDAIYNRMKYNLFLLYMAVRDRYRGLEIDNAMINILNRNFSSIINKNKEWH